MPLEVDRGYLRSPNGGLKMGRMAFALCALISFAVRRSHEAFLTLAIMELVISFLFFVLYLLSLNKKMTFFFWPLADAFNSLVAALFLLIVGLCATIMKTILETLVGGVFCLLLFVLCVIDAALILKNVSWNNPAPRT
ncbi:chemokine-like factor [Hemicordylus capensis]|uniref:chemokine-like factor n=1 Tax=Hemicordylus capensis TaxID=884348 RepID=UPI0023035C42|nr:chemokine-like factor [Hemicordylus capensis]